VEVNVERMTPNSSPNCNPWASAPSTRSTSQTEGNPLPRREVDEIYPHFALRACSVLRVSCDVGDLQPLFGCQAYKFESGAHVGSVPHDGYGCNRLITQSEINGDRFSDIHFPLHDGSQTALAQIEADPVRAPYTPAA
jgi:hypothetical protein